MREFIQNQQFYYVNDEVKILDSLRGDELDFQLVTSEIDRVGATATSCSSFLIDSINRMDSELDNLYRSYIEKIGLIKSGAAIIQAENLSTEDNGYYAVMELNTSVDNSVVYSIESDGFIMPPYDERYAK